MAGKTTQKRPQGSAGKPATRRTGGQRLRRALLLLFTSGVVIVAALPWIAGTAMVRSAIVSAVNNTLAPSRIELHGLSLSWFGSLHLTGLKLEDGHGKTLLDAERADIDRSLVDLLFNHSHLGTVTLHGAKIDIERRADGSIDLVDAIAPKESSTDQAPSTAGGGSPLNVTLRVVHGSLRLRTPELVEPLTSGQVEMEVNVPAETDRKLSWQIDLSKPEGRPSSETLEIDGDFDHHAATAPDLSLSVKGARWPLALSVGGLVARGELDGVMRARRQSGVWASSADAKVLAFDATGPALAGDRLKFPAVAASWDLAEAGAAWTVHKLALNCPVASLVAAGSIATGHANSPSDASAEARVDLATLSKLIPNAMRLRKGLTLDRGSAHVVMRVKSAEDSQQASVTAEVSDVEGHDAARTLALRAPATFTAQASRTPAGISVRSLELRTAFVAVNGSGDSEHGIEFAGSLDLAAIESQFRDLIDFGGLSLSGKGKMAGEYRRDGAKFLGRYALELHGLQVAGLTAEPVRRDFFRFDATATGPFSPTGLPVSWDHLLVHLKSGKDAISIAAQPRGGSFALQGSASLPVTIMKRDGRVGADFSGSWKADKAPTQGALDIDQLRLVLRPDDAALVAAGTVAFAARGRLDLASDDLTLLPLPVGAAYRPPLALAAAGLKIHGVHTLPMNRKSAEVELVGDLTAIDRALVVWAGQTARGLEGSLAARLTAEPGEDRLKLRLSARVPDLIRATPDGGARKSEGAVELTFDGAYEPAADRIECGTLALNTPYARVDASGRVDAPTGRRIADLSGTLAPDWHTLNAVASEAIGSPARVVGKPRAFHVKGPLSGDSLAAILKGLDAELGLDVSSAHLLGLTLGPAPVVVRCKDGSMTIDPIETTLNEGRVVLKPALSVDDAQGIALQLRDGSAIEGAKINDEVSLKVLSYVAPVLDRATRVSGSVSADVQSADIPITGPPSRTTSLSGHLAFQDVAFAPGPGAREILAAVGMSDIASVRIHQPVQLSVADRRVIQKGLELTIRRGVKFGLQGSVGFDRTLDLRATVPITKAMLGPGSRFEDIADNDAVTIPIGGTVSRPAVDRRALRVALRDLSKKVVRDELSKEASGLINRLEPAPAASGRNRSGRSNAAEDIENKLLRRLIPRDDQ